MAHNLAIDSKSGEYAMFVTGGIDAAWHKLGQRTPNAVTWEQAIELAHLNWTVAKKQLYGRNPLGQVVPVDAYGIFREDNGAFLGSVGARYNPIQNQTKFKNIDTLLERVNGAHYDSAGALGNGEVVWCSAKVPFDFEVVAGDALQTYLLGTTAHDGSRSDVTKLSTTRVVCQNTLGAALNDGGQCLKVRHTKNAMERMQRQAEMLAGIGSDVKALQLKLRRLADVRMTRETMQTVLDRLFPKNDSANQTRRDGIVSEVLSLYESNDRNAIPAIRGTAYNLLNAVTQYSDHFRTARTSVENPTDAQTVLARATSATFGSGDKLKTEALDLLLEESNNLPLMIAG